jgi:large subunit ribosomal protein L20
METISQSVHFISHFLLLLPKVQPCYYYTYISMVRSNKVRKVLKLAKGYRGRSKNNFRLAIRRVQKGLQYAYRDRRQKKRNVRKLWIQQVNAGVRAYGTSYSEFMHGLKVSNIELDRKVLSDMAANEPYSFKSIHDVCNMLGNLSIIEGRAAQKAKVQAEKESTTKNL